MVRLESATADAATARAIADSCLRPLPPQLLEEELLTGSSLATVRAGIRELSDRVLQFIAEIPGAAFTSVRQRVARHLLELAEAVGSAREVVVRILRELRESGTVRTERDRIVILEPERLIEPSKWNPGY
jgi:CRP/FNR family transcriptional regulator, cyclic AMP receptor protein